MRGLALLVVAACGGHEGPPHEWIWIPVEESRCMDGSSTGFGLNRGAEGGVVVHLEGGGACYDQPSCATVAHQDGFGPAELDAFANGSGSRGLFDRAVTRGVGGGRCGRGLCDALVGARPWAPGMIGGRRGIPW